MPNLIDWNIILSSLFFIFTLLIMIFYFNLAAFKCIYLLSSCCYIKKYCCSFDLSITNYTDKIESKYPFIIINLISHHWLIGILLKIFTYKFNFVFIVYCFRLLKGYFIIKYIDLFINLLLFLFVIILALIIIVFLLCSFLWFFNFKIYKYTVLFKTVIKNTQLLS